MRAWILGAAVAWSANAQPSVVIAHATSSITIATVVANGRVFDRAGVARLLEGVERAAH
jgi:hypothetical protein